MKPMFLVGAAFVAILGFAHLALADSPAAAKAAKAAKPEAVMLAAEEVKLGAAAAK
jgi:hypothetical protein